MVGQIVGLDRNEIYSLEVVVMDATFVYRGPKLGGGLGRGRMSTGGTKNSVFDCQQLA